MGVGVEGRRVPVGLGERLGDRTLGLPGRLGEHFANRLAVQVTEGSPGQRLVQFEHLEEIEFEVPDIALVVPHIASVILHGDPEIAAAPPDTENYAILHTCPRYL